MLPHGGYTPTWRHADTPKARCPVLLFAIANPAHADHVGERPLDRPPPDAILMPS